MKDKQKQIVTGSKEEDTLELASDSSVLKTRKLEFKWDVPGEELKEVFEEKEKHTKEEAPQVKSLEMPSDFEFNVEEVEKALQKILDSDWGAEVTSSVNTPMYMLSLENDFEYLYSLNRKTFVPVRNHLEVIPIDSGEIPGAGRSSFFAINEEVFDIDPEKVICIGWN